MGPGAGPQNHSKSLCHSFLYPSRVWGVPGKCLLLLFWGFLFFLTLHFLAPLPTPQYIRSKTKPSLWCCGGAVEVNWGKKTENKSEDSCHSFSTVAMFFSFVVHTAPQGLRGLQLYCYHHCTIKKHENQTYWAFPSIPTFQLTEVLQVLWLKNRFFWKWVFCLCI